MDNFFNTIGDFFRDLFASPLSDMTALQLVCLVLICIAGYFVAKKILKFVWAALKLIGRGFRNIFSAKHRCSEVQCKTCGRTLDKCVCAKNKKRGYVSRLYHYHKEEKAAKLAAKTKK